jgi:hypothetical protein
MDATTLSTLSGLAGAIIGGATSLATTWLTMTSQTRAARLAAERSARQDLYGRYMDEIAALYAAAIKSEAADYDRTTGAFALKGRITFLSSRPVADAADKALRFVVDLSMRPKLSDAEVRSMMEDAKANVIDEFARACRTELSALS